MLHTASHTDVTDKLNNQGVFPCPPAIGISHLTTVCIERSVPQTMLRQVISTLFKTPELISFCLTTINLNPQAFQIEHQTWLTYGLLQVSALLTWFVNYSYWNANFSRIQQTENNFAQQIDLMLLIITVHDVATWKSARVSNTNYESWSAGCPAGHEMCDFS
jgi:hypothetical protein